MTKEHSISITGLSQVRRLKPGATGNIPIAYFDCTVNGIELIGCVLVRTERRGIAVWPPKIPSSEDIRRGVGFSDSSLRAAIQKAARDVYRNMGGQHAEWEPREEDGAAAATPEVSEAAPGEDSEGLRRFVTA